MKTEDVFFILGVFIISGIIWAFILPGVQCIGRVFCY